MVMIVTELCDITYVVMFSRDSSPNGGDDVEHGTIKYQAPP